MSISPGETVLDAGSGSGIDTVALAKLVGPTGQVIGVDYDEEMIAAADRTAQEQGVALWVHHRRADATLLPFGDNTFHAARSERLFQHLKQPETALAEMIRVTRPGGRVVLLDTDWGTLSIDTGEIDIERRLARFGAESLYCVCRNIAPLT